MDEVGNGRGNKSGPWKWLAGGLICGIILTGIFAWMINATDQRQFCASCHIMREAAVTQKKGMHANLTCNECHAPHNLLAKLPFKAMAAVDDVIGNIKGEMPPKPPRKQFRDVVQKNCIACHAPVNVNVASMAVKPYCVDCHRGVAHMPLSPISERTVGYD